MSLTLIDRFGKSPARTIRMSEPFGGTPEGDIAPIHPLILDRLRIRSELPILSLIPLKRRVECNTARSEIIGTHIPARFGRPMDAVHPNVFPFD